jgi:hypothetical protein
MGPPMLIGAGLGALSSAAMGKSPFTGALLGGVTGGAFGGAGGFGSGFGLGDAGGLLSNLQGVATTPVSMGTGGFASGIGGQVIPNALTSAVPAVAETVAPNLSTSFMNEYVPQNLVTQGTELPMSTVASQPSTYAEGIQDVYRPQFENISRGASEGFTGGGYNPNGGLFGGIKDMFGGLSTSDKLGLGLKGVELAMQPTPPIQPASGVQPIQKKPFDPSSAIAAAPSYGITKEEVAAGKVGQIASKARLNDEDERKIRQFYTSLIG